MARETLKVHSKGGFTTIYNLTIRDNNLSNKSLGLLVKLLSLPENWNFSFNGIVAICKDGKSAVSSEMEELKASGYLYIDKVRDKDGTYLYNYNVYDTPQEELIKAYKERKLLKNKDISPEPDFPVLDNPELENQDTYQINNNKEEIIKDKKDKKLTNFKDDRFIELFIGEDYKWIIKRPVNIYALLLSWIYFLYRKMYITGIIGLIITGIVCRLYPSFIYIYIPIVMILSGIVFNPLYKAYANFRINRIREKNYGTDDFAIEQICQEKGGTNVVITLIVFLVFLIIMFRTYYKVIINNENTEFWTENSENRANCISNAKSDYKILTDKGVSGILEGAVCNIRRTNSTKSYDIYIKISNKDSNVDKYIYFKDGKDTVTIEGMSVDLQDLQNKNKENTITEEEKTALNRMLEIKDKYIKVSSDSNTEDELIRKRKNKDEKLNYVFSKDEILR